MNEKILNQQQPWYRHRWPWILMAGPALVVFAGFVTAYLAVVSNDGLVADDYYKQGLAVNQTSARDRRALALGMRAEIRLDDAGRQLRLSLTSSTGAKLPDTMVLHLTHPTRSGLDHHFTLVREADGRYAAALTEAISGRWRVVLEDMSREWRLADDWMIDQQAVLRLPVKTDGVR